MKHAREDYNRIQDPAGLIPDDEPVFLLRAKDVCAVPTIATWIAFAENAGASPNIVDAARQQILRMQRWQRDHPVKTPDMPEPPLTDVQRSVLDGTFGVRSADPA